MQGKFAQIAKEIHEKLLACDEAGLNVYHLTTGKDGRIKCKLTGCSFSLATAEHWLCKLYIFIAQTLPSRCQTKPNPSSPHTQPLNSDCHYPDLVQDIFAASTASYMRMVAAGTWTELPDVFKFRLTEI
jgi:hypothetical protein